MSLYYNPIPLINKADELKSPFVAILGGKGNGKTYGVIHYAIKQFFETGRKFVYLRRRAIMIKKDSIETLLNPHIQDIINLSKGRYNQIKMINGNFYLCNDADSKIKTQISINRALSNIESQTGADLGELSCVIFDEVLSREIELNSEFNKMMIAHANYIRNRTHYYCPFFLLGNTFTRDSAIFTQFGCDLRKIKQGQIYTYYSKNHKIRCILEYCAVAEIMTRGANAFYDRFDDNKINMISHGSWTVSEYKPITTAIEKSDTIFTYRFKHENIICDVLLKMYRNDLIVITQQPTNINIDMWISDTLNPSSEKIIKRVIDKSLYGLCYAIANNMIYTYDNETTENLRDIVKHIRNGAEILKYME